MPETIVCSKGHLSSEPDYCSECGVKIAGPARAGGQAPNATPGTRGPVCPDCGTLRTQEDTAFCEVCGFNFITGAHGEISIHPEPATEEDSLAPIPDQPSEATPAISTPVQRSWKAVVSIDETLRAAEKPDVLEAASSFEVPLDRPAILIGRTDEGRAILPEIALAFDEAVSRRHALLQQGANGVLLLRDIGAANGTRLNGTEIEPMRDYPVQAGDEITLGRWSRIRIEAE